VNDGTITTRRNFCPVMRLNEDRRSLILQDSQQERAHQHLPLLNMVPAKPAWLEVNNASAKSPHVCTQYAINGSAEGVMCNYASPKLSFM
jgi:hypothetical protein